MDIQNDCNGKLLSNKLLIIKATEHILPMYNTLIHDHEG